MNQRVRKERVTAVLYAHANDACFYLPSSSAVPLISSFDGSGSPPCERKEDS